MINVGVTITGPLFKKKISDEVKGALVAEVLEKVGKRMERGGKGLGAKRNIVSRETSGLVMEVDTTKHRPRTKGKAWARKNVGIAKSMARRVLRKAAKRIVEELG